MAIRELRKQLGLTQEQLAKLVGVKQATVSAWESGDAEPTMKNTRKLMAVLNCTGDELIKLGGDSARG
jgi:transcriptional regulator with XRE-family HTH domain